MATPVDQQRLAQELVDKARTEGVELVGPGGMLTGLTKSVLETALEEEMSAHLGYDKHDPVGRNRGNSRTARGARPCSPRSARSRSSPAGSGRFVRAATGAQARRLDGIDAIVLSLTARGLTTGGSPRTPP